MSSLTECQELLGFHDCHREMVRVNLTRPTHSPHAGRAIAGAHPLRWVPAQAAGRQEPH